MAVIGLFGIGEILLTMEERLAFRGKDARLDLRVVLRTWAGCRSGSRPCAAPRSAAGWASRWAAPRRLSCPTAWRSGSRDGGGARFGKGEIEGVVAPETAAHAAGTAALLPMLTLGIPGSPTAAVLLGGL